MAYVDTSSNTRRTTTAIAVAAIQAGVIYAVATGLAVKFVAPPPPIENPEATQIPIRPIPVPDDPKPKPQVEPRQTHERDPISREPDPRPSPPPTGGATDGPGTTGGTGTGEVEVPYVRPTPPPPPFTPRAARPRNAPAGWATANDYPSRDLREGNQGVTGFSLSIGANGDVLGCQVTRSSGFPSLDRTACEKVTRRARFEPAIDGYGNKVAGTYSNNIRWQVPD